MKTQHVFHAIIWAALAVGIGACSQPKPEPVVASSAGLSGYALEYPAEVNTVAAGYNARLAETGSLTGSFAGLPGELTGPPWPKVKAVVEKADEAGRGRAYADGAADDAATRAFFEEEKDEITKRVANGTQAAAKKQITDTNQTCEVDVYGAVSYSLKEGVSKQLEKRMRGHNEAQLLIDRHEDALGKKNVEPLRAGADRVSRASHLVRVGLVEDKVKLNRLLAEAGDVEDTLDDDIAAEKELAATEGLSKADKQASAERLAALTKSRAALDGAVAEARKLAPGMPAQIDKAQKDYAQALDALLDAIDAKAEEAPSK
ncbi:MAG: hypothetical protein PHU25_00355 [Deltaproteobacteria bacterium]|nr:hypothetical protein [Deltaproteobacteria bacterium]